MLSYLHVRTLIEECGYFYDVRVWFDLTWRDILSEFKEQIRNLALEWFCSPFFWHSISSVRMVLATTSSAVREWCSDHVMVFDIILVGISSSGSLPSTVINKLQRKSSPLWFRENKCTRIRYCHRRQHRHRHTQTVHFNRSVEALSFILYWDPYISTTIESQSGPNEAKSNQTFHFSLN